MDLFDCMDHVMVEPCMKVAYCICMYVNWLIRDFQMRKHSRKNGNKQNKGNNKVMRPIDDDIHQVIAVCMEVQQWQLPRSVMFKLSTK